MLPSLLVPSYLAVSLGYGDIAKLMHSKSKGRISSSGPNEQNALHAAVLRSKAMTEMLLKWNKDLTEQADQHGSTPLHYAVSQEERSYIRILWFPFYRVLQVPTCELLEVSTSPAFQPDETRSFPIHIAASMGVQKAISILLKRCPECACLRDVKGRTFLHVAVENKRRNVVMFACRNTWLAWILNMQDSEGNTALHQAIQAGNVGIFGCLMGNQQICLNLANKNGHTPLDLSQSKIPPEFSYKWTTLNLIYETLKCAKAEHGNYRWDRFEETHTCRSDVENESKRLTELTQVAIVGSVLISTVTFAAAFTLPGGYKADDQANGGTPTLAGSYAFHAFIISITVSFIYSTLATFGLIYSAMPFIDLHIRRMYLRTSLTIVACSLRSLSVSFALAIYVVVAPVDRWSAFVVCLFTSVVIAFGHVNVLQTLTLARALHARKGYRLSGMLLGRIILQLAAAYWSYILIFGMPAYLKSTRRIGGHGS